MSPKRAKLTQDSKPVLVLTLKTKIMTDKNQPDPKKVIELATKLIKAINENQTNLWGDHIECTYDCVLMFPTPADVKDDNEQEFTGIAEEVSELAKLLGIES